MFHLEEEQQQTQEEEQQQTQEQDLLQEEDYNQQKINQLPHISEDLSIAHHHQLLSQ